MEIVMPVGFELSERRVKCSSVEMGMMAVCSIRNNVIEVRGNDV